MLLTQLSNFGHFYNIAWSRPGFPSNPPLPLHKKGLMPPPLNLNTEYAPYFILFPIVNKTFFIFRFLNKTPYQYSSVHCWQSRCFLTGLLQYLPKNMALLVQKFMEDFLSEFVSGYLKTKKNKTIMFLFPLSSRGVGVKALGARQLNK